MWWITPSAFAFRARADKPANPPCELFQRQKNFRDRLMLRHLREEAPPLEIDREVAGFLAAGRKPVTIKVERGGLTIVGVADDAQHRAASAGDLAGFDLLAVRLDRLVGPDTKVHAIIGRRRRTPL